MSNEKTVDPHPHLTSPDDMRLGAIVAADAARNAAVADRDQLAARVAELETALRAADDLNAVLHEENAALRVRLSDAPQLDEPAAATEHVTDADVAAPPWPSGGSFDLPK